MHSVCDTERPSLAPKRPTTMAASSGASGTTRYSVGVATFRLSLERVEILDDDRAHIAEQQHQNSEADRRFRGGDRQNEKDEHLARHVAQIARERDEVEVDGEEHQLDRHQHDDDVAPVDEDAGHRDGEEDRPQYQIVGERRCSKNRHPLLLFVRKTGYAVRLLCRVLARPALYVYVLSRASLRAFAYSACSPHFALRLAFFSGHLNDAHAIFAADLRLHRRILISRCLALAARHSAPRDARCQ